MFERTLEMLVNKSITSLPEDVFKDLLSILADTIKIRTYDEAYDKITDFYKSPSLKNLYDKKVLSKIEEQLKDLKSVAALYCCYFGMDYIYQVENPEGEPFGFKFIDYYYDCNNEFDVIKDIFNVMKRQLKGLEKVKLFKDSLYENYGGYKLLYEKEGIDYQKSHIYLGNIIRYLDKSCKNKDNKFIMHDLVPSATIIALRSVGALPNGGDANKSSNHISGNLLNAIDKHLQGSTIRSCESYIPTINLNKVQYDIDPRVKELISLAVIDDIYRMDRINQLLMGYIEYVEKDAYSGNFTMNDERAIAKACSLLLPMPLGVLKSYKAKGSDTFTLKNFLKEVEEKNEREICKCASHIITFNTFTFPYLIGLLCFMLFYKGIEIKSVEEIKEILRSLEEYILHDYKDLKKSFDIGTNRIWSNNKIASLYTRQYTVNKGTAQNKKKNKRVEWSRKHNLEFYEVTELMLSQTVNILKSRVLLDENFTRIVTNKEQQDFRLKYSGEFSILLPKIENKELFRPERYVTYLVENFVKDLYKGDQ
jgi:hypothetical protein